MDAGCPAPSTRRISPLRPPRRARGTGRRRTNELVAGDELLSPELQQERIESFDATVPPNSSDRAYGLGLTLFSGWYGHTGELPGFNTIMQHHLAEDIALVVMVNSDIPSGDCPQEAGTVPGGRTDGPCQDPATYIADALSAAIGFPLEPVDADADDATDPVGPSDTAADTTAG